MFKDKLPGLEENVLLAPYTTFRIGGPAKYFYVAKKEDDLVAAIRWAKEEKLKYYVLGGGSNLLVSDDGFNGLVIKNENFDFEIIDGKIRAGSGLNLAYFVMQCLENSLAGAEYYIGIPGTIGASIYGNAGAWGHGLGELVESIKVFDGRKIRELSHEECQFIYRGSLLKDKKYIVLSAVFALNKGIKSEIETRLMDFLRKRSGGQQPKEPSAGCVFKNIEASKFKPEKVKKGLDINDEEFANATKHGKLAIGYVIEKLDLKGKKIGGALVSPRHGNFVVSDGTATGKDVITLISYIKQQVRDKIGVELEEEIQYLGF